MSRLNNFCRFSAKKIALDPVRLTPTKTVASQGKVIFSESTTTVVVLKLKIEKGKYSVWPLDRTKKTRTCISYHRRTVAN